jgi:hypothetical protein
VVPRRRRRRPRRRRHRGLTPTSPFAWLTSQMGGLPPATWVANPQPPWPARQMRYGGGRSG